MDGEDGCRWEVDTVSVFYAVNNGPFTAWLQNTKDTSKIFTGQVGNKYSFYCTATDTVGNAEMQAPSAEASTTVVGISLAGDVNRDGVVDCKDIQIVKA